jgi:hypothetical protein
MRSLPTPLPIQRRKVHIREGKTDLRIALEPVELERLLLPAHTYVGDESEPRAREREWWRAIVKEGWNGRRGEACEEDEGRRGEGGAVASLRMASESRFDLSSHLVVVVSPSPASAAAGR